MSGNRTERPTPRRLREARRRGDVPRARELAAAAALLAGLAALGLGSDAAAAGLARSLRAALEGAAGSAPEPLPLLRRAAWDVARWSAPACAAAFAAAALASLAQGGATFAPGALRPRWERLDPAAGLRRMVSPAALATSGLALAQAGLLVVLGGWWLRGAAPGLASLPRAEPAALPRAAAWLGGLAVRLGLASLALGAAGAAVARWRHARGLRMTRDEVRREQREEEGDPLLRAERRRLRRALAEAAPASRATVVVVNPAHVAVALRHDRARGEAPRVLAKGAGVAAAVIRSAARRAAVPIVRDPPLARALFRLAEVGDEIPEELYDAAAAVLAILYSGRPEAAT